MRAEARNAGDYSLVGAINPRGRAPAICVPAFSQRQSNSTYVQYVGIDDAVAAFETLDANDWEPVRTTIDSWVVARGQAAIHWVAWSDDFTGSLVGPIERIRSELLQCRWIVDTLDNPFERLDFAQLSGHRSWFSEEAHRCERSFANEEDRRQWLEETLLLSRVRFAIDTVLVEKAAPRSIRRRLGMAIRAKDLALLDAKIDSLANAEASGFVDADDTKKIRRLIEDDLVCNYVRRRLAALVPEAAGFQLATVSVERWSKRLTPSDVQRKTSGNQRGGITLTKAEHDIVPQTYFREVLFGDAEWIQGENHNGLPLETAVIKFHTHVLNRDLGQLNFTITNAPNREARQGNHTSTLHSGPLTPVFKEQDLSGTWLTLEREPDGSFHMAISAKPLKD